MLVSTMIHLCRCFMSIFFLIEYFWCYQTFMIYDYIKKEKSDVVKYAHPINLICFNSVVDVNHMLCLRLRRLLIRSLGVSWRTSSIRAWGSGWQTGARWWDSSCAQTETATSSWDLHKSSSNPQVPSAPWTHTLCFISN